MAVNHRGSLFPAPGGISLALVLAAAGALAVMSACGAPSAPSDGPTKAQPRLATVTLNSGDAAIEVEVADSEAEKQTGLMFRTELADGQGMIFVYAEDRQLSFWMKNTLIPLSIAFLASDGTIRTIKDMQPGSLATVDSERYVRYAVEAPLGWFDRAGLAVGDRFELPAGFPGSAGGK